MWTKIKIGLGIVLAGILAYLGRKTYQAGQDSKEAEQNEQVLEDVKAVKEAHDEYQSNDDVARRVRDEFRRKE